MQDRQITWRHRLLPVVALLVLPCVPGCHVQVHSRQADSNPDVRIQVAGDNSGGRIAIQGVNDTGERVTIDGRIDERGGSLAITESDGNGGELRPGVLLEASFADTQHVRETLQKRFEAGRVQGLKVRSDVGDITVRAVEGNEILIRATRHVTGNRPEAELRSYLSRLEANATLMDGTLVVEQKPLANPFPNGISGYVSYEITTPKRLALNLRSDTGSLQAIGMSGGITLQSQTGEVTLRDVVGTLDLSSSTGSISVRNARVTERLKLRTSTGQADLMGIRATGSTLKLDLRSDTGDLRFTGDASALTAASSTGQIEITTTAALPLASADLRSETGDVTLTLPASASARVQADTQTGEITLPGASGGRSRAQNLTLGTGSAPLKLRTTTGSIHLQTK